MEKGEIAHYEQFLLFPQHFQKTYTKDTLKQGHVWERVKSYRKTFICKLYNCRFYHNTRIQRKLHEEIPNDTSTLVNVPTSTRSDGVLCNPIINTFSCH